MIRWPDGQSKVGIFHEDTGELAALCDKCHGIFNYHTESAPRFNFSSEGRHLLQRSVPSTALGQWDLLGADGRMPPAGPPTTPPAATQFSQEVSHPVAKLTPAQLPSFNRTRVHVGMASGTRMK